MTATLAALSFDATDPAVLARFWAELLSRELASADTILPADDTDFPIRFLPTQEPKVGPNQLHFELTSSSLSDQQQTVAKALERGARHIDVGQRPEEGHIVLADPDGNEFCVIEPDNNFLAGCGTLVALSCDGSQAVGYFWSAALGWPLVWDQDEETAIQSPRGGTKISWGGPPLNPRTGRNRLHFDLAPLGGAGLESEVERLLSLGAGPGEPGRQVMADPDGNEFCLLAGATDRCS